MSLAIRYMDLPDRFICSICRGLLEDPHQLQCGCRCCRLCEQHPSLGKCIGCSDDVSASARPSMRDVAMGREMAAEKVMCPEANCRQKVTLVNWREHYEGHQLEKLGHATEKMINIEDGMQTSVKVETYAKSSDEKTVNNDEATELKPRIYEEKNLIPLNERLDEIETRIKELKNKAKSEDEAKTTPMTILFTYRLCMANQRLCHLEQKSPGNYEISDMATVSLSMMASLNVNLSKVNQRMEKLRLRECNKLKMIIDGKFVWRVTKFSEKVKQAKNNHHGAILSDGFHTSPAGYKLRLKLYPNGDGQTAVNSHMSLYLVICRGKFDQLLSWPFASRFALQLLPQKGGSIVSMAFKPNASPMFAQATKTHMNEGSGISQFFPLDQLFNNDNLIKNDTIFLAVKI